jgi:hypothetical protein
VNHVTAAPERSSHAPMSRMTHARHAIFLSVLLSVLFTWLTPVTFPLCVHAALCEVIGFLGLPQGFQTSTGTDELLQVTSLASRVGCSNLCVLSVIITFSPNVTVRKKAILRRMREVQGSYFVLEPGYIHRFLQCLAQIPRYCLKVYHHRFRPHPCLFMIHNSTRK